MLKRNKNQNYVRNLFIPKFSNKILSFTTKTLEVSTVIKLRNYLFSLSAHLLHIICFIEHNFGINETDTIALANSSLGAIFCRNSFKNGGVSIFTHTSIQSTNMNLNNFCKEKDLEICAVKLHLLSYEVCIITVYRSPSRNFQYFIDNLEKHLSMIRSNTTEIII